MARIALLGTFATALFATRLVAGDEPAPSVAAASTSAQVREAVGRAIGYLQTECGTWMKTRKCATCHHAAMAIWSLSEADRQGYAIDKEFLAALAEQTLGSPEKMIESKLFDDPALPPDPRPLGKGVKTGTAFMAAAARSLPSLTDGQKQSLRFITEQILSKQREDGSWEFFLRRPPINESETSDGAWIVMALQGTIGPDAPEAERAALAKAITWLDGARHKEDLQEKALQILISTRAGKRPGELQPLANELLPLQQPDGGWRQKADMPSDAFATGQALYALALAGYTLDRPEVRRGVAFVLASQQADGSWPMTSRATPDGSEGSSTLLTPITMAGTAWSTLALTRLVPGK